METPVTINQTSTIAQESVTLQPQQPQQKIPQPPNSRQITKLNQLNQSTNKPMIEQEYNLEYIFNKIKEIGRIVQLIRIERRGIIYGTDLWELLNNILGKEEINQDLNAEVKNYEFNMNVLNAIEKRIIAIPDSNPEAYPDYYMNNIVKLYNQNNSSDLNMVSLMHMGLDIGQLEYLMYKYMSKPIAPCYIPKKYDPELFIKVLLMVQSIGRTFKKSFSNELPDDKNLFPQLITKYVQDLFENYGSELINQMSKFKIDRDKIKLFFDVTMDDDLHNADNYNIQPEDTVGERAYKVSYKYLRDDSENKVNEYKLTISYKLLFTMLDLYDFDKPHLPIDKLIDLMFYSGELLASIGGENETGSTTFFENMKSFDDVSINKLFDLKSYFKNNDTIPNKNISELLDTLLQKIKKTKYAISSQKIIIIPEHISYLPIEITQLFCLIKPKLESNVDLMISKINELMVELSNPALIDDLFNRLKDTVKLNDVPVITSILTPENDLDILGIDENQDEGGEGAELGQEGEMTEIPPSSEQEEMSGGNFFNKYIKYKVKYLNLKLKNK